MKKILIVLVVLAISFNAYAKKQKAPDVIRVDSGTGIASMGLVFDASYDPRTDNILPGHKILSVAITNNSINILKMDALKDEWQVVDYKGGNHTAINDLRKQAPDMYINLPEKLRHLVAYPEMIQVGDTKVIDLIFKDSVNLEAFRMVKFMNSDKKVKLEINAKD